MERQTARAARKLAKERGVSQHRAKRDWLKLDGHSRYLARKKMLPAKRSHAQRAADHRILHRSRALGRPLSLIEKLQVMYPESLMENLARRPPGRR